MSDGPGRILTSHVGSLPRPAELIALNRLKALGESYDAAAFDRELAGGTAEVVRRQGEVGIDLRNDGEYGHTMSGEVEYASFLTYAPTRLGGMTFMAPEEVPASNPPKDTVKLVVDDRRRRDWQAFSDAYGGDGSALGFQEAGEGVPRLEAVCTGPLSYAAHAELQRGIENLKSALASAGGGQGFMCALGPGDLARSANVHYGTEEEYVWACAEAMREEYMAITNAGLVVQIDEPAFAENWDQFNPAPSLADYRKFTMVRVEALNHALRGIPNHLRRFHLCWGSWHGPHTTDIPLRDIIGMLLKVDVSAYSFEAANVRHEHEWEVWEDMELPDGKVLLPGVVSHATNVVEHPELVAQRLERFARVVGRDNVIASTDCGLGGRVHPQIAWAKLASLVQGAQIASARLWRA